MGYIERKTAKWSFLMFWYIIFYGLMPWLAVFWVWNSRKYPKWQKIIYTLYAYVVMTWEAPLWLAIPIDGLSFLGLLVFWLGKKGEKIEAQKKLKEKVAE